MEVFTDSRCRIYEKKTEQNKKRIHWVLKYQFKKYPTPLQGSTYANFLFSPDLNYFIDVAVIHNQFVIKSSATNEIVIKIPRGLYGFKTMEKPARSIRVLASRIMFESENTLRIINKHGLDTILQLNYTTPDNPVTIKSVVKIDHFDELGCEDHAMLD